MLQICQPPLGVTLSDSYSWEIYCTGLLFDDKTKVDLVASRESNVPTQGLVELQGHRCAWIMRLYTERLRQRTAARRYADVSQLLAVRATRVPGARRRNCVRDILQR